MNVLLQFQFVLKKKKEFASAVRKTLEFGAHQDQLKQFFGQDWTPVPRGTLKIRLSAKK